MVEDAYFNLLKALVKRAQRDARSKDAATRQAALEWLYGDGCDFIVLVCGVSDEKWFKHVDELVMEKAA